MAENTGLPSIESMVNAVIKKTAAIIAFDGADLVDPETKLPKDYHLLSPETRMALNGSIEIREETFTFGLKKVATARVIKYNWHDAVPQIEKQIKYLTPLVAAQQSKDATAPKSEAEISDAKNKALRMLEKKREERG